MPSIIDFCTNNLIYKIWYEEDTDCYSEYRAYRNGKRDFPEEGKMKKTWKKYLGLTAAAVLAMALCACSGSGSGSDSNASDASDADTSSTVSESSASEDYFEWEDNIIVGLTEEGAQQTSLVIPARCEGFTEYAFAESAAETLVSVNFESDEKITSLNEAFKYLTALEEITLPASLTDMLGSEFIGCESLKEIVIPEDVLVIGDYCFNGCASLTSVVFEGGTEEIGEYAFWRCDSLSEVVFCDSITSIGEHAFYQCEGITSLTLPASLKTVGEYAFYGLGLEEIYVPEEMETESVDGTAFYQSYIVPVYVVEGSWIDENFDEVFYSDANGVYEKNYI